MRSGIHFSTTLSISSSLEHLEARSCSLGCVQLKSNLNTKAIPPVIKVHSLANYASFRLKTATRNLDPFDVVVWPLLCSTLIEKREIRVPRQCEQAWQPIYGSTCILLDSSADQCQVCLSSSSSFYASQ